MTTSLHRPYGRGDPRRLYPPPDRRSVPQILVTKLLRHVPLLPGDHSVGHQNERGNEQAHEPCAVRPYAQAELEQRERQIDRIPREPIRSRPENRRDGLPSANRCPRPPKLADRKREQRHCEQNQQSTYRLEGGGDDSYRPDGAEPEARKDGHHVHYRWSGEHYDALVDSDCSVQACLASSDYGQRSGARQEAIEDSMPRHGCRARAGREVAG